MLRPMLNDELWLKLKEILQQHEIYDKPKLRRVVEAMLYRMRVGCPWRDLPADFGCWNSIYQKFNCWSSKGKLMSLFKALVQELLLLLLWHVPFYGYLCNTSCSIIRMVVVNTQGNMMHPSYVYILASPRNGTLYVGSTSDIIKRTWEHKNKVIPGFTAKYNVHILVYYEAHELYTEAAFREKRFKNWPRKWKINLIEKLKPQWRDLYEEICQ